MAGRGTDDGGWTPFTLAFPRTPLLTRLRGRHALVRGVDRVEAAVLVLAFLVSLIALPVAGAVGTAAYSSLSSSYAAQADHRHLIQATVGEIAPRDDEDRTRRAYVPATWMVDGVQRSGTVRAAGTAIAGDTVEVWVDDAGEVADAPASPGSAAAQAATGGVLIWAGATVVAVSLYVVTRSLCNRVRESRWDNGLCDLTGSRQGGS